MNESQTILAVDDTSESLTLLANILTAAGYRVRPADSGELALAAVAANPPDLILLDVRLGGISGIDVCRRLKAREETMNIPVILISAFADVKEWVEGLQAGAADYITKPFQAEELLARVKTHLALGHANLSLSQQGSILRATNEQLLRTMAELKMAQEQLLRSERAAALSTLAGGIAHQFNNINAIALGYLQIVEVEPNLSEKTKSYLAAIRKALERSVEITSRLMPFSVTQTVEEVPLSLASAVGNAVAAIRGDVGMAGASIEVDLTEGISVTFKSEQLAFVLQALLVNAWHAVLGQPVRKVKISTGRRAAEVYLRVEDTGHGISKEKLSRIFTPFFSEKGEHAPKLSPQSSVKGVGLSLSVANSIVTGHAGRIEVESAPGVGSTFTVWLPQEMPASVAV